jgi:hypothetical protein
MKTVIVIKQGKCGLPALQNTRSDEPRIVLIEGRHAEILQRQCIEMPATVSEMALGSHPAPLNLA